MKHNVSDLGELEREVLHLVWKHGASTADWVQKALSRPLKESTVRTVLKRLEAKGHLTHSVDNRTFVYEAADTRGRAAARAVKRIVDRFCSGSLEEVLDRPRRYAHRRPAASCSASRTRSQRAAGKAKK